MRVRHSFLRWIALVWLSLFLCRPAAAEEIPPPFEPEDEATWFACDGIERPADRALMAGLKLAILPLTALNGDRPPQLDTVKGIARGDRGIEACHAALQDPRSRQYPDRRTIQFVALAAHTLESALSGDAGFTEVAEVVAAWEADNADVPRKAGLEWMARPLMDILSGVALAEAGDPRGSARLAAAAASRPANRDLVGFAALASLSKRVDPEVRRQIWWSYARMNRTVMPHARGLQQATTFPFLPDRRRFAGILLPGLYFHLPMLVRADQVSPYGAKAPLSDEGYEATTTGDRIQIVYMTDSGMPTWSLEMAVFRAAELAGQAGASHIVIESVRQTQKVRSTPTTSVITAYATHVVIRLLPGGPPADSADLTERAIAVGPILEVLSAAFPAALKKPAKEKPARG
ncbi:hypothetical protein [Oleisolibacter albus]|uniref:hypothetical protein n=1 Tax=Oleisolibacter albus TaxID=2171757 RepID=UPI000DF36938|nr:hypothetical protein [Oleisolibacter albus]